MSARPLVELPSEFCWTKFGVEAGESAQAIVQRKERERRANGGIFLWGIGNSIRDGIRRLVEVSQTPQVVFSPMRAKPKSIDESPSSIVVWSAARRLDGHSWSLPSHSVVTSRGLDAGGSIKLKHYALVCAASSPLQISDSSARQLSLSEMVNILSGNPLGFSQVTSVVRRTKAQSAAGPTYGIGWIADLVFPYFVVLENPNELSAHKPFFRRSSQMELIPEIVV